MGFHNPDIPWNELERRLSGKIRTVVDEEHIGFAYGALAAGSDILIAEELLDVGAELHVVLPFAEADFLEQSVAPAGQEWVRRYHDCKARAASLTFASSRISLGSVAGRVPVAPNNLHTSVCALGVSLPFLSSA